jgi:GalNAc-alpha-(1->4)-GalNAc-alpha-(1->3)-diNAcBac-PP-undecaprenol alpha-1,4-N-acetyl-D-galactosaminyltransferase
MKKIIFVAQTLNRGGAERVVSLLSQEFERIGYDVIIILFDNKIQYRYGGKIININTPPSLSYITKLIRIYQRIKRLKKIFLNEKPDYIFSFMESCNFASILTGEKVIVSIRNNPNKKHNWYQKTLIKFLYKFRNIQKIVAVSGEIEKILIKDYKLNNTTSILNPIIIDNNYKTKEDLSKYKPYILSVGRLNIQKNFEMLITAYSNITIKNNLKLLIVGEGNERIKLEKLIKDLDMEEKILLIGQKENIKDYYLQSEIYILSSSFEGFPNVLVEALSNNCACISTDCPTGPSEIIVDEKNGLLVENENQEKMTKAIERLYCDKELKSKFANNAQKSIEHLKLEKIAKEWLKI